MSCPANLTQCRTVAGPDPGTSCVLPFTAAGRVHSACAPPGLAEVQTLFFIFL